MKPHYYISFAICLALAACEPAKQARQDRDATQGEASPTAAMPNEPAEPVPAHEAVSKGEAFDPEIQRLQSELKEARTSIEELQITKKKVASEVKALQDALGGDFTQEMKDSMQQRIAEQTAQQKAVEQELGVAADRQKMLAEQLDQQHRERRQFNRIQAEQSATRPNKSE